MMHMLSTRSLALLPTLMLCACLSTHAPIHTERYHLPEVTPLGVVSAPAQSLVLEKLQLADILDSDRIVMQMDDVSLQTTRDHLWAAPLSEELTTAIHARLASRLPQVRITAPRPGQVSPPSLQLSIAQFQGTMQGYAVLSGEWQWRASAQSAVQRQQFSFSTALTDSGYPALVRALGQNLDLLSDQLARTLTSTAQASAPSPASGQ